MNFRLFKERKPEISQHPNALYEPCPPETNTTAIHNLNCVHAVEETANGFQMVGTLVANPEQDAQQIADLKPEQAELINKMIAGLTAALLAMDHLLGPNWFRADPDHVAAIQACLDGLDAYQMLASAGVSPPPKRVLNFITQRVKLDGYLRDGITDICGCAEVIDDGFQLCHFHRQHYFAYRQKADPKTMLSVQRWAQKRRCAVSVWKTKGAIG